MGFYIIVRSRGSIYRLMVEHMPIDERTERFKVFGRNKTIILESNRPFFRNRGLKRRKPEWKVVEGEIQSGAGLEQIIECIMARVDKDV